MAGVYVHIPFCHAKCAYCDFFSTPRSESAVRYIDAVVAELEMRRHELRNEVIRTLYVGGGTPSSLDHKLLHRLLDGVVCEGVEEFTVEVNPEDVNCDLLSVLKSAGVNRVSMGVQSLNDDELVRVGRRHSAADAIRAIDAIAQQFDNFSLDIIFGLPGQTIESLETTVSGILSFRPPHLSAYLLSYEPGTRLYAQLMTGKVKETSDSLAENMYRLVTDSFGSAGYEHYEISNYALPGMMSRHNSSYWNMTPYLGLGASAHSFDGTVRRFNPSNINEYISAINARKCCYIIDDETDRQRFNDRIIVALRTAAGLDIDSLSCFPGLQDEFFMQLMPLVNDGRVIFDGSKVVIPPENWLRADSVIRELILDTE